MHTLLHIQFMVSTKCSCIMCACAKSFQSHLTLCNPLTAARQAPLFIVMLSKAHLTYMYTHQGFPGGSDGKEFACTLGDLDLIPGLGRSPGGGHGNALQYSCVENPHGQRSLAGYSPWGHMSWT